jgi:hypothetical protein
MMIAVLSSFYRSLHGHPQFGWLWGGPGFSGHWTKKELTSDRDDDDDAASGRPPERWSAQREMEIVLRVASTVEGAMYRG